MHTMRGGIVVSVFLMLAYSMFGIEAAAPEFQSIIEQCMAQYPVSNAMEQMAYFKQNGELMDESDKNAKCQFFCMPNKLGIVDDNGVMDKAKAKDIFLKFHPDFAKPDAVDEVFDRCQKGAGGDVCESTYEYKKCMMKEYLKYKNGR